MRILEILVFVYIILIHPFPSFAHSKIDKNLLEKFKGEKESDKRVNIFLELTGSTFQALEDLKIDLKIYNSLSKRSLLIKNILKGLRDLNQKLVLSFLDLLKIPYHSFWISNEIFVKDANLKLIEDIAKFQNVLKIREEKVYSLDKVIKEKDEDCVRPSDDFIQWGIRKIGADKAWSITRGEGVVIGAIDSGVRITHEAIASKFVGYEKHGYFDSFADDGENEYPTDEEGHGTHVLGTVCGDFGIGVCPGCKWAMCKACNEGCPESGLKKCGERFACLGPKCAHNPRVINNSWGENGSWNGDGRPQSEYESVINAWIKAGIIPVFSQGNSGQMGCKHAGYPGSSKNVIAVGGTQSSDEIFYISKPTLAKSGGSSFGPTWDNRIKPEYCAPGQYVMSSFNANDTDYECLSGTSMASPHLTGSIGLLLSVYPDLTYEGVKNCLTLGVDTEILKPSGLHCGRINEKTTFPNNAFGLGLINICKSLSECAKKLK